MDIRVLILLLRSHQQAGAQGLAEMLSRNWQNFRRNLVDALHPQLLYRRRRIRSLAIEDTALARAVMPQRRCWITKA